ncbi:hypothetical protein Tco_1287229, partial [Tanacetum coccineum]
RVKQPAGWSKRPAPVSAGWLNPAARPFFRPSSVHFNNMYWPNVYDPMYMTKGRWGTAGDPSTDNDIGIVDSGCSRSMTGNKEKLDDFVQVKGGIVKFGGGDDNVADLLTKAFDGPRFEYLLSFLLDAVFLLVAMDYAGGNTSAVVYAANTYIHAAGVVYAANTSIHAAGLVCAGSIMFLLADVFLLVVTCFCCAQFDIAGWLVSATSHLVSAGSLQSCLCNNVSAAWIVCAAHILILMLFLFLLVLRVVTNG